ncbi:MAG: trypsin-like peptidase domain-containing protein [Candidatus Obscuribacterales bacterium]|nr:trypsin-like peptidase domain-containing protein [Candidatus Obscuribacterales bacterium]
MAEKNKLLPWFGGAALGAAAVGIIVVVPQLAANSPSSPNTAPQVSTMLPAAPVPNLSVDKIATDKAPLAQAPGTNLLNGRPPLMLSPFGENTVADIAKDASDSVVNIDIRKSYVVDDGPTFSPFGFGDSQARTYEARGVGTGVIYRSDGYILTNNHVVGQADDILVTLNDKRKFKGKVVGRDTFTDLALVKIEASNLPVARFGTSVGLRPGEWAIAIGSPLGMDHSVTLGIISALGRQVEGLSQIAEVIQTDAAINPGNSGGPLLNIHGEVIGLNEAIRGDGQNIGFAIPVDTVKDVAKQLIDHGSIARAYLGINMQEINPELAQSMGLPDETKGVLVARTMPDGPAAKAGIENGDIIQRVDGSSVQTPKDVQKSVFKHKPNDKLSVLVSRNGALKPIMVTVGDRPTKDRS